MPKLKFEDRTFKVINKTSLKLKILFYFIVIFIYSMLTAILKEHNKFTILYFQKSYIHNF